VLESVSIIFAEIKMDKKDFEKLVEEGIAMIPEEFLARLENVAVVVEGEPTREQLRKAKIGRGVLLLGLYEGVPQTRRGPNYGMVLPDKITIFQKSIEKVAGTENEIREQVKNTVWHEIAHHFGSSEESVRAAESRRRNDER
jgi:predicted Zn-dependent protease with MMP-like domain